MARIARLIALPIVSAGIIGGAALGLAGTAGAAVSVDNSGGIVATPDIHAHQQMMYPMRHGLYYWPSQAHAPHVDTTVHQSR
ncbi:MAG: hypothetical protein U1D00_26160 [Mycobacterium sp.]|nr:hypothetical protein [Mycobacterium sp.]